MMLFIMSFLIPEKTLVIYSTLPQIMVAVIGLARSPKVVEIKVLANIVSFAFIGAIIGYILFQQFSVEQFHYLLAGAITVFGIYLVLAPQIIRFSPIFTRLLDFSAGISQMLFGISGPIMMARLLSTYDNKTLIRNYALAFFLSLNSVRLTSYIIDGSITEPIFNLMLISAPFLFLALWFSNHLHFKINEKMFRKVVSWIILLGGIILLSNSPN